VRVLEEVEREEPRAFEPAARRVAMLASFRFARRVAGGWVFNGSGLVRAA
jgi:hypothetical protein